MIEDICGRIIFDVIEVIIILFLMESLGISELQAYGLFFLAIFWLFVIYRKSIWTSMSLEEEQGSNSEGEGGQSDDSDSKATTEEDVAESEMGSGENWWEEKE